MSRILRAVGTVVVLAGLTVVGVPGAAGAVSAPSDVTPSHTAFVAQDLVGGTFWLATGEPSDAARSLAAFVAPDLGGGTYWLSANKPTVTAAAPTPAHLVFVAKDLGGGAYWLVTSTALTSAQAVVVAGTGALLTVNEKVLLPVQAALGL